MIKPIIFNTEMVRATLDGRKTVTRRLVKPQPEVDNIGLFHWKCFSDIVGVNELRFKLSKSKHAPYQPDDILYVRETFVQAARHIFWYKADDKDFLKNCKSWKPSIHMPKEAARIWLKVTDVRVERLQEITADGIRREGLSSMAVHAGDMEIAIKEWELLWNSTIKKSDLSSYGWEANPWVWVVEFIKIDKQEEKYHAE